MAETIADAPNVRYSTSISTNSLALRARVSRWKLPEPLAIEPIPEPVAVHIEIVEMPQETMVQVYQQEPEPVVRCPSIHRIIEAVCKKYNVTRVEILSARRTANIVRPRHVAMYLAKQLTLRSYPAIGRAFGGRDHTSILSGVRKITRLRAIFRDLDADITELEATLGGSHDQ